MPPVCRVPMQTYSVFILADMKSRPGTGTWRIHQPKRASVLPCLASPLSDWSAQSKAIRGLCSGHASILNQSSGKGGFLPPETRATNPGRVWRLL